GEILVAELGELVPGDDIEPVRLLAAVARVRAAHKPGDGDPKRRHRRTIGSKPHFGISAQVTGDDHLVIFTSHCVLPPYLLPSSLRRTLMESCASARRLNWP